MNLNLSKEIELQVRSYLQPYPGAPVAKAVLAPNYLLAIVQEDLTRKFARYGSESQVSKKTAIAAVGEIAKGLRQTNARARKRVEKVANKGIDHRIAVYKISEEESNKIAEMLVRHVNNVFPID